MSSFKKEKRFSPFCFLLCRIERSGEEEGLGPYIYSGTCNKTCPGGRAGEGCSLQFAARRSQSRADSFQPRCQSPLPPHPALRSSRLLPPHPSAAVPVLGVGRAGGESRSDPLTK